MTTKVAINGFGRIGRLALRTIIETNRSDLQVVAINDLGSVDENAHLFRYDSIHGRFAGTVTTTKDSMDVGKGAMKVLAEKDPAKLPWKDLGVELVLECTGRFTKREEAEAHLKAMQYLAQAHAGYGIWNLGTGQSHSVLDIVHTFERVTGQRVPYQIAPRRSGDLPEYYASTHKANTELQWQARRGLEDMLRDAWRWESAA